MNSNSLHIELPSEDAPGFVPWMVVALCTVALVILVSQLAISIPASLQQQAQNEVDASPFRSIQVVANGRDIELTGSILVGQSTADLVRQLQRVDGIRHVQDRLVVIDPAQEAKQASMRFSQALSDIDLNSVAFQPGSIAFTPESDTALAQLLGLMQQFPQGRIRIEGHTDNTGPDAVNLRMSRDRASAVANYLMARGIAGDQLIVTGYGATQPIADNDTESGRARNRRIEISAVN